MTLPARYLVGCGQRGFRCTWAALSWLRVNPGKGYNSRMAKSPRYTPEHAAAGLDAKFPEIETWPNQFPGYEIVVDDPEFTSV